MTNDLERLLELERIENEPWRNGGIGLTPEMKLEKQQLKDKINQALEKARKYDEYVQSLYESSGQSLTLKEIDDLLDKWHKNQHNDECKKRVEDRQNLVDLINEREEIIINITKKLQQAEQKLQTLRELFKNHENLDAKDVWGIFTTKKFQSILKEGKE